MKIAIHHSLGSFSERWILYCDRRNIPYKLVNCYDNDIIEQLSDCDALLWHHNHANPKDQLFAKQLLYSLEQSGLVVFPDFKTDWHFDDKLGQKYLFEAFKLPRVKSYAFYSKKEALSWVMNTEFPKVFKLRRGAGSRNVFLVKNKLQSIYLIHKAFNNGFRQYDAIGGVKESLRKFRLGKSNLINVLKAVMHLIYPIKLEKAIGRERGYVYFQDFIPNNEYDIRIIVIGDKAFAIKRFVRKDDFRASGSGFIEYGRENFNDNLLKISFEMSKKMQTSCVAFDFIFDNHSPLLVEVSYGFSMKAYDYCTGYWNDNLEWFEGQFNPYSWIIDDVISKINENRNY